jgi:thiol-disulfide isomerase/thioredoxin
VSATTVLAADGEGPIMAQDFSLKDLTGQTVTNGGLRGSNALLLFGTTWCPHSDAALPILENLSEAVGDELQTLFIAVGQTAEELADAFGPDLPGYRILPDYDRTVSSSYGIKSIPTCVFVDQKGLIQYSGGPSEGIVWRLLSGERPGYRARSRVVIPASTTVPTCLLYTVGQQQDHLSQLLGLDLRNKQSYSLGDVVEAEMQALAVHPLTGVLYAVTDEWGTQPGLLYAIDRATGSLTAIGPHGFKSITALAFRWTDDTLWGWAEGAGLVELDTATGAGSLHYASNKKFSGLAWANDDSLLYASVRTSLWSYREADATLELVADNLPRGTSAIEMRSDGVLVGIACKDEPGNPSDQRAHPLDQAWPFIYDPANGQLVWQDAIDVPRVYPGFAGLAWSRACGNPSPGGPADIIQNITLDKTELCPGENVLVTVDAVHPESPQGLVDISINGRLGSPQYLQFTGTPGPRVIVVTAATPEKHTDMEQVTIEVVECNDGYEFLEVTLRPNLFQEHTVDFEITNAAEFSSQNPVYVWNFGDSQSLQTTVPYASHSYVDAIVRDQFYTNLQATITMQRSGLADLTAHKTLTLWNTYAFDKQRGLILPPVESDEHLQQSGPSWTGNYTITNLEDEPIQFTSRHVTYHACDPDSAPISLPADPLSLEVPGQQSVALQLEVPTGHISLDICGVEVSLTGQGLPGQSTHASAYFAVRRNPVMAHSVDDQALRQLLNQIAADGLVVDPLHITDEELYRLAREDRISWPPDPLQPVPTVKQAKRVSVNSGGGCGMTPCEPDPGNPNKCIGKPCVSGDTPPRPGLSCQVTGNWCVAPPHIANARKGDAILSAECGMIGGLLRMVGQKYSHSGIMTRNYYQITHSTAAEDRYKDNMEGLEGSDGFDEMALRYGWPGVITQSVHDAFNGAYIADPSGKDYFLDGFNADPARCEDDTDLVWPKVVKPPPGAPPSVREQLRIAADQALTVNGHYRWYAYSDATIVYDPAYHAPAVFPPWPPPDVPPWWPDPFEHGRWAAGTVPTICSQLVWYSLKLAGAVLEGPNLEESDVKLGAERDSLTQDGLYLYTESDRRKAAYWLHKKLYDTAYGIAGWFGEFLLDAADNISNQFCNCMGSDGCSIEDNDSEAWKFPGVGRAVSPSNILFWDGPDTGGVYGHSEPLVYRGGDYVAETTWQVSEGVGTFAGRVLDRGSTVPNASVEIAGLELFTDTNGEFRDEMIPAGTYEVVASKLIGGLFMSVRQEVTIKSGETTTVDLILKPPPAYIRRVVVDGWMYLVDHETWPWDNETGLFTYYEAHTIDPFVRDATINIERCVGDEVRGELTFRLHLREDDNMTVEVYRTHQDGEDAHAWLYEGTDCETDDLEAWAWWYTDVPGHPHDHFDLPAGVEFNLIYYLENPEIGSPDSADFDFIIRNEQQTFPTATALEGSIAKQQTLVAAQVSADTTALSNTCWDIGQCAGRPKGDATCDGSVNLADIFAVKANFGKCAPWTGQQCCADFTRDGCINLADLFTLKAGFGSSGYSPSTGNQNCPP